MPPRLNFPDARTRDDVLTFTGRAATVGDENVRLQASGGVLALTCSVLAARTLLESTPTILAMRTTAVDPEVVCDLVVSAAALSADGESAIALPETAVTAMWAGISPPRAGWAPAGEVTAAALASRAQWGIQAVAEAVPDSPGDDVVQAVRTEVWGAPDDQLHDLPRGAAFAAFALGFIGGDESARVLTAGEWSRVALTRGHVLVRAARGGLTPVRRTGGR